MGMEDFLEPMLPAAVEMLRRAIKMWEESPAEILVEVFDDGKVYTWKGGKVGIVARSLWPGLYSEMEAGGLPWALCVLAMDMNFVYVVRADEEDADAAWTMGPGPRRQSGPCRGRG